MIIYNKSAKSTLAFCLYLVQNGGEMASNEEPKEQKLTDFWTSLTKAPLTAPHSSTYKNDVCFLSQNAFVFIRSSILEVYTVPSYHSSFFLL